MPNVRKILSDPVTQHMRGDVTRLHDHQTAGEALDFVRASPITGRVVYFYVVDDDGVLKGVGPTRRLLLSEPSAKVADIMIRQVIVIPHTATVLDACEFFSLTQLLAF